MVDLNESTLNSMYGDGDEERGPAQTYQVMNGLRLSGAHIQKLQFGDRTIEIPGVKYMQLLEEQLRDSKRKLRNQESTIQRLERRLGILEQFMGNIKNSKFFPTYE